MCNGQVQPRKKQHTHIFCGTSTLGEILKKRASYAVAFKFSSRNAQETRMSSSLRKDFERYLFITCDSRIDMDPTRRSVPSDFFLR